MNNVDDSVCLLLFVSLLKSDRFGGTVAGGAPFYNTMQHDSKKDVFCEQYCGQLKRTANLEERMMKFNQHGGGRMGIVTFIGF